MDLLRYSSPVVLAATLFFLLLTVCSAQFTQNNTIKPENKEKTAAPLVLMLDKLPPEVRRYVKSFRQQHTLYREMPRTGINCDKEMFCFLKQHPDLVIGFWEVFGATEISLKEIKENCYRMTETGGTAADISVLYQTPEISIVYAKGEFRSPMLVREIEGETLLLFYSQFTEDKNGNPFVICRLETFIRISNGGADFLARLFSSVLGKIADNNYEQTLIFVRKLSAAACLSPNNVKKISHLVKNVRREVITDFDNTADSVFERAEIRRERFTAEHTEFTFQATEEPPITESVSAPLLYEKQLPELSKKQNYVVPSPPFSRSYTVSEQQTEESIIDMAEELTKKPKSGAVFGKPKIAQ